MQGEMKIYAQLPSEGSADMPWKVAKICGQISVIKIAPYNTELLGMTLENANESIRTNKNMAKSAEKEETYNCIIVLTHEGTLSIFNLQSLITDYNHHIERA